MVGSFGNTLHHPGIRVFEKLICSEINEENVIGLVETIKNTTQMT